MKKILMSLMLVAGVSTAYAEITVQEPWVRATVAQQKATGAFMKVTSTVATRLVGAESPAAEFTEVHEMAMHDNVMKMRQIEALPLEAGKTIEFKPGSYHFMLLNLREQAKEGAVLPIRLIFENADGQREQVEVKAVVKPLATAAHRH